MARCWRFALGAAVMAALHAAPVVATYRGRVEPTAGAPTVRLLFLNLNSSNADHEAVLDHITHEAPDFVVLAEVHEDWMPALAKLEKRGYPHQLVEPHFDNFGIGLFSRHPLRGGIVQIGDAAPPSIVASSPAHQLTLVAAHVWPPISAEHAALRNQQLLALADRAAELGGRVMLVGDFNATPWSPVFSTVLERGGLHDSRRGFGLHTTWPAMVPSPLRIPIDHVLTSRSVVVTERRVGPYVGSDHLSVIVDVALQ